MRTDKRHFVLSLAIALGACGRPSGAPQPGEGGAIAPPTYHTQQLIPRVPPGAPFFGYRPAIEKAIVDLANGARTRSGLPTLYTSPIVGRDAARAQSDRMAARGAATLTADDLAQLRAAVVPMAKSGDFWVFVNQVSPLGGADVAQALVTQGPRPMISYNLYALKPNFSALGVGVRQSFGTYYATVLAYQMTGGVDVR